MYAEEEPVRGYARAPVKKEVCAALRIILEEALIVDCEVLSTRLKTRVATVVVGYRRAFDGDERIK